MFVDDAEVSDPVSNQDLKINFIWCCNIGRNIAFL